MIRHPGLGLDHAGRRIDRPRIARIAPQQHQRRAHLDPRHQVCELGRVGLMVLAAKTLAGPDGERHRARFRDAGDLAFQNDTKEKGEIT